MRCFSISLQMEESGPEYEEPVTNGRDGRKYVSWRLSMLLTSALGGQELTQNTAFRAVRLAAASL